MTTRTEDGIELRAPLSRDVVLRAAIELADSDGIESLTMRRLGHALGVEAMSLYNHIVNKDDLLSGIAEIVFEQVVLPPSDVAWKSALRTSAISACDVLLCHPWAHAITMTPSRPSPARLRWMEAVLRTMREAGFSAEMSCRAFHTLDSHITGFTLWLTAIPVQGEELRALAVDFLQKIPADQLPYVAEHIEQHTRPPRAGEKGTFEFGLDLILDGLERLQGEG
jgi:AcrR family transcriptional regulator